MYKAKNKKGLFFMKKFRKLIAFVVATVMFASYLCVGTTAVLIGGDTPYVPVDEDVLPTIIVPGLFQSETKYYDENGNFNPQKSLTRAEAATMFMRYCANVAGR